MAIVKHLSNHSGNYKKIVHYLMFAHDELNGRPIKDKDGNYVLRERFLMDGINCEPFSFATECAETNSNYPTQQIAGAVTAHHYIISFDPNDVEYGLTDNEAHAMVLNLAREWFGGHQCIVFTHPDGDNHAHNIHTHVVINSIRIKDEPIREGMEEKWYWKAGYKHRHTDIFINAFKQTVMDMCRARGLNQVNLLEKNHERITEAEYWVERRARAASNIDNLGSENKNFSEVDTKATSPIFTRNAYIRKSVRSAISAARSFNEFVDVMRSQHQIEVKVHGTTIVYKRIGADKGISGRRLGLDFEFAFVKEGIEANRIGKQQRKPIGLISELQDIQKARKSVAYARKVRISNVQKLAETISFLQRSGIASLDELDAAYDKAIDARNVLKSQLKSTEDSLTIINRSISAYRTYAAKLKVVKGYRAAKNKQAFYNKYREDIGAFTKAKQTLHELYGETPIPKMNDLLASKTELEAKRDAEYSKWCDARFKVRELSNVRQNIEHVLGKNKSHTHSQEER